MSFFGVAAAVVGGAIASRGSRKAASAQEQAAQDAAASNERIAQMQIDAQEKMLNRQIDLNEPTRKIGVNALTQAYNQVMPGGEFARDFGMSDFQADPGYSFRLKEGMRALENNAAARGGLISGNALRATQKFGQDLASGEYQNAYNRFQTNRTNRLNPLFQLGDKGQIASNQVSNSINQQGAAMNSLYGNLGQANSNAIGAAGEARASGYLGQANSLNKSIGSVLNAFEGYGGSGYKRSYGDDPYWG